MKLKKTILAISLLFLTTIGSIWAQKLVTLNTIGENHTISSKYLKEDRIISIYLPENYKNSNEHYAVFYILDGQRYFLNGVVYQKTLSWQEKSPEFIVVGIETDNTKRRTLFDEQSKIFIKFLEQELVSYIDTHYRTTKERFYFGWEMAGGLALEIIAQPKPLFSAYFIASPTHISAQRLDALKSRVTTNKDTNEFLFFTLSPVESWSFPSLEELGNILKTTNRNGHNWQYKSLIKENHHSTPTITIHEGLSAYFEDFPYLRFYSLKEFEDFGGMSALVRHYKNRGEKYNLSTEIHKETKHFLLLQSIKEDNYTSFQSFMNSFENYYQSKNNDFWFDRYAQFYLKHKNADKALEILNNGLQKFNNSALILSALGDSYLAKQKPKLAKQYYSKAFESAVKNKDSNIEFYKKKLID